MYLYTNYMLRKPDLLLTSGRCCAGFRNCGIIHMTNLPQAFDQLEIGINKDKTIPTGKTKWTGITRHVEADLDVFAALADLIAHEFAFRFIDMLQSVDVQEQQLCKNKVLLQELCSLYFIHAFVRKRNAEQPARKLRVQHASRTAKCRAAYMVPERLVCSLHENVWYCTQSRELRAFPCRREVTNQLPILTS